MFDKLKSRFGAAKPPTAVDALADRLTAYPAWQPPHRGHGKQVSESAARENLAYFNAQHEHRLQLITALLREHAGIDTAPALEAPLVHGLAVTQQLSDWAGRHWPALAAPSLAGRANWLGSDGAGGDILLSVALDVARLLGEIIRRGNADWRWDLDLARSNLRDDMTSSRRVVLLADPVGAMAQPFLIDTEDIVASRCLQPGSRQYDAPSLNPWRRMVDEGLRGEAMAYWRTTARPAG